jgi:hypothetical protein
LRSELTKSRNSGTKVEEVEKVKEKDAKFELI